MHTVILEQESKTRRYIKPGIIILSMPGQNLLELAKGKYYLVIIERIVVSIINIFSIGGYVV